VRLTGRKKGDTSLILFRFFLKIVSMATGKKKDRSVAKEGGVDRSFPSFALDKWRKRGEGKTAQSSFHRERYFT